jgi:NAD(P)H dehydrogenase (quinone)
MKKEHPGRNTGNIRKYADQLLLAEGILFVYPSWWYGLPAMLKGYFDRVWLPGVAFDVKPDGRMARIDCAIFEESL